MLGTSLNVFSQAVAPQGYFSKWQLFKYAIFMQQLPKFVLAAALGPPPSSSRPQHRPLEVFASEMDGNF